MTEEERKLALRVAKWLEVHFPALVQVPNEKALVAFTLDEARALATILREAAKPAPTGFKLGYIPEYPEGDVAGPCICGSWPGGPCLHCAVKTLPAPPAEEGK